MNPTGFRIQVFFLYCWCLVDIVLNAVGGTVSHDIATQIAILLYVEFGTEFAQAKPDFIVYKPLDYLLA